MKKYRITIGLVVSFFFALSIFLPRPYRSDYEPNMVDALASFVYSVCCWLVAQWVIIHLRKSHIIAQAGVVLVVCIVLSVLSISLFHGLPSFPLEGAPLGRRIFAFAARGVFFGGFHFFIASILNLSVTAQKTRLENEQLKKENLQARLFALQQQVNPHFLFNSLTTLRTIAADKATRQYVQQLSNVYRYLLNTRQSPLATVEEELAFIRSYLYILKERFEDALQIEISIDNYLLDYKLPPMSLQLLIENVIKHNSFSAEEPVNIRIYNKEKMLYVSNNLQPRVSVEERTGTGLRNIQDRYQLICNEQITIAATEKEFTVALPLIFS